MSRKIAALTLVVLGLAAPTAVAATAHTGKSTNRNGTVRLTFSRGLATLTLSPKLARKALVPFQVECRATDGDYSSVVAIAATRSGQRRLQAPAEFPSGATRCRVKRAGKTVATMRMRRA